MYKYKQQRKNRPVIINPDAVVKENLKLPVTGKKTTALVECFALHIWIPGKASCKKTNSLAVSEASHTLSLDIVRPATENTCSDREVSGMLNNCAA